MTLSSIVVLKRLALLLAMINIVGVISPSLAQQTWGGKRAPRVEVSEIKTRIIADFAEVQGRVIAGSPYSVTATTDAITKIVDFRIGDIVSVGDVIATQDSAQLELVLEKVRAKLYEAEIKLKDLEAELLAEEKLLAVTKAKSVLLAGKAKRAEELVAKNALASDAAEMALNESMDADLSLLTRQSKIARKKAERDIVKVTINQTKIEITRLLSEIKNTKLRAKIDGQLTFIADYRLWFARKGEVVAKITDLNSFEIEAEIPVKYLSYLNEAIKLSGRSLDGKQIDIVKRVALPLQNLRSATRTVRFSFQGKLPSIMQADNAVIVIKVPTTSPIPKVIVPKDAVIPVAGGHIVFRVDADKAKRQSIKIGEAVDGGFIVKRGLTPGQKVVVRGNEQLIDGKQIQVGKLKHKKLNGQTKSMSTQ